VCSLLFLKLLLSQYFVHYLVLILCTPFHNNHFRSVRNAKSKNAHVSFAVSVFPQVKTREMLKVYLWNSIFDRLLTFVDTFQMLLQFDKITSTVAWRPTILLPSLNVYRNGKTTNAFYSIYNTLFSWVLGFSQWLNTSEWAFWYYYAERSYYFALLYSAVKYGLSNKRKAIDRCISS
jgi:hypothetical protein